MPSIAANGANSIHTKNSRILSLAVIIAGTTLAVIYLGAFDAWRFSYSAAIK